MHFGSRNDLMFVQNIFIHPTKLWQISKQIIALFYRHARVVGCLSKLEMWAFLLTEQVQTNAGIPPASTALNAVSSWWISSIFITKEMERSTVADTMLKSSSLDVQLVMRYKFAIESTNGWGW